MGLKCSLLGHSFEPAGVERDREEQGSEVVTVVRELEQCSRCGTERVVSENTEVTTVVEPDEIEGEVEGGPADTGTASPEVDAADAGPAAPSDAETADADERAAAEAAEAAAAVDELAEGPEEDFEPRDPEEEDAEILTDDEPEREPGEWPDDGVTDADDADEGAAGPVESEAGEADTDGDDDAADDSPTVDPEFDDADEESLSGITVPEGTITCESCEFTVDAESSYRDGDPCPECGAWLVAERDV